jgi:hypothetical protein
MSLTVNKGMIPPGGWHFPAEPGIILKSDTYNQLEDMLFKHRTRLGQSTVAVKQEIDRYFCSTWPSFCQDVGPGNPLANDDLDRRVARFASFLASNQPSGGYQLVSQQDAQARAEVCVNCPMNEAWRIGCRSCSTATHQLLIALRKMRNTPQDPKLLGCSQAGGDLQTMVHLPVDANYSVSDGVPDKCWRKK